jgi:hypothetical protein
MSKRKAMDVWIRECMTDADKEGRISSIALVVMIGMQEKELHVTRLKEGDDRKPIDLAELFRGKAETFCQDSSTATTFRLMAFYGGRPDAEAIYPFTLTGQANTNTTGLMTEQPTPQGLLQQDMRFKEAWMAQVFNRQAQMDRTSDFRDERAIQREEMYTRMIAKLMTENMQAFDIVKDMMMKMAEREFNRDMELENNRRATQTRDRLLKMVPPLVNQFSGKEIFPQSSEDTVLIEAIAENLTPEYIAFLENAMPKELWAPLSARLDKYNQEKAALEAKAKALPAAKVEDDIDGAIEVAAKH